MLQSDFNKVLREWLLPPKVLELLYSTYIKCEEIKYFNLLAKNKKLKDIHKRERCFIIGNGPSIKNVDLTKLKDEYTFVSNSFFLHKKYAKIRPNYYSVIDGEFFKGTKESKKFFTNLSKKAHKDTTFFFPVSTKDFIENKQYLTKSKKYYLQIKGEFKEDQKYNIDLKKTLPSMVNVMLSCLIIANYMGFSKIYLLGFDHNWLSENNLRKPPRFYKKHYFKNDEKNTYENGCFSGYILFKSYRLLRRRLKATIINCTKNSYLDVFERRGLEDVLK
jgi:hypothetical protein